MVDPLPPVSFGDIVANPSPCVPLRVSRIIWIAPKGTFFYISMNTSLQNQWFKKNVTRWKGVKNLAEKCHVWFEWPLNTIVVTTSIIKYIFLWCTAWLQWNFDYVWPHIPGVNLINNLCKPFLYKSALHSFSLITVWPCNFLVKEYWRISCLLNVEEIDYR